jgi:hypothetical protein
MCRWEKCCVRDEWGDRGVVDDERGGWKVMERNVWLEEVLCMR